MNSRVFVFFVSTIILERLSPFFTHMGIGGSGPFDLACDSVCLGLFPLERGIAAINGSRILILVKGTGCSEHPFVCLELIPASGTCSLKC